MDFKQLQYMLKVAECQNITRAAEQLFVSQPALSSFISKTEEEIGARLFNRGSSPLTLTPAGEEYIKTARQILGLQDKLKKRIDDLNHCREGMITLGLSDMRATVLLPFVLPHFARTYPNLKIRTVESNSTQVEENVKNGTVDLGIVPLYQLQEGILSKELYQEEILLVSLEELNSQKGSFRPWVEVEELNNRDFILLSPHARLRKAIDAIFMEHSITPRSIIESSNHMTAYLLASTGTALALVPEGIVRMMNPIHIPRTYSIGKRGFKWNIGAIWREDQLLTSAQKQLIHIIQNRQ